MNLQYGCLAAYLDLPEDPRVTDLYTALDSVDAESFGACLRPVTENLQLFSAPSEMVPYDAITPAMMPRFLSYLKQAADLVIFDLPVTVADWASPLWQELDMVIAVSNDDVRCRNNFRRLSVLSRAQLFRPGRCRVWINRLPLRPRGERAGSLAAFERGFGEHPTSRLPDVGYAPSEAQAMGTPLRDHAPAAALTKAIAREVQALSARLGPRQTSGERNV